jgi:drug/metabolite transporter (DMT)-like permease
MLGVGVIAGPQLIADGLTASGSGTAVTLLAPLSYAAGNVWFRCRPPVAPLALTAGMFAAGTVVTLPLALALDGPPRLALGASVWAVVGALVVLATVTPAVLNYILVRKAGAMTGALVMFLMPAFAVIFGMAFAEERLPPLAFVGLAMVIAAALRTPAPLGQGEAQSRKRPRRSPGSGT